MTEYLYLGAFQLTSLNVFKGKGYIQEQNLPFVKSFKMGGIMNLGSNLSSQCEIMLLAVMQIVQNKTKQTNKNTCCGNVFLNWVLLLISKRIIINLENLLHYKYFLLVDSAPSFSSTKFWLYSKYRFALRLYLKMTWKSIDILFFISQDDEPADTIDRTLMLSCGSSRRFPVKLISEYWAVLN